MRITLIEPWDLKTRYPAKGPPVIDHPDFGPTQTKSANRPAVAWQKAGLRAKGVRLPQHYLRGGADRLLFARAWQSPEQAKITSKHSHTPENSAYFLVSWDS